MKYQFHFVGFEVFTAVVLKSIFFWDVTPCSALSGTRRFGGTYRLHLQGRRIVQQSSEQASGKQRTTRRHIPEDSLQFNFVLSITFLGARTRYVCIFVELFHNAVSSYIASNDRMIDELERIRKEAVVAQSKYPPRIWLQGLRNTTEKLSIVGDSAEIGTEHFPNTGQDHYRFSTPVGVVTMDDRAIGVRSPAGTRLLLVGFQVFTSMVMKSIICWDMTPCSPLCSNRRFGGT
jgi:hypothetical protein